MTPSEVLNESAPRSDPTGRPGPGRPGVTPGRVPQCRRRSDAGPSSTSGRAQSGRKSEPSSIVAA
eukprot:293016-Hanusia_phi.AAC.2